MRSNFAAAGLALAAAVFASGAAAEPLRIFSLPARVSELQGRPLTDFEHRPLGRVTDFMLDLANARLRYAIVDTANGTRPLPFDILTPSLLGERLLLDASRERLAQAPERIGGAEAYWSAARAPRMARASELLGRAFRSAQGDLRGTLADVVIDAHEGNVVFALAKLSPGRLHPVPLHAFTLGEELILDIDPQRLERDRDLRAQDLARRLPDREFLNRTAAYADRLARGS